MCVLCVVFVGVCVVWCGFIGVLIGLFVGVCMCVLKKCGECAFCCGVLCCVVVCGVWCVARLGTRKTPSCVESKRLRVYVQEVSVCRTHAGVLPVHTETS